jgi:hypothetical protein
VSRNKPYAGGFITEHYGRPGRNLHALQIEINRGLYMNEASLEKTEGFGRLLVDIGTFVVLGIRNRGIENLFDQRSAFLLAECQHIQRLLDRKPANLVSNQAAFLGRDTSETMFCNSLHDDLLLPFRLLVGGMTAIGARQRKFAELVTDHVFINQHRNMLAAVVYCDCQTNHLGADHRTARPCLDWPAIVACNSSFHLLHQVVIDKWTFVN